MSAIAYLQRLLDAGLALDVAMIAAREHEAVIAASGPRRSKGAERQARYEERKRQKTSENVRNDATDASPSLPSSPQTLSLIHI